ncbi:MAG: hypothetical protein ABWX74_15730 [Aeromicrobium sp.]
MVAQKQKERVAAGPGAAVLPDTGPDPSAGGPPRTWLRRRGWAMLLVAAVLVTMVLGFRRLSDDLDAARGASVQSVVDVGSDGSVDVVQRIAFAAPRSRLTVSVPARPAATVRFAPRIDGVRLRVDGLVDPGLATSLRTGGTHTFSFSDPATSAVLSYSVDGAVVTTKPSARGRALALVTPLSIDEPGSRRRLEIGRDGILNLGCTAGGAPMTACGSDVDGRWVVERDTDDPVVDVVAQVDLTATRRP